jgi:solute carrier family 25 (mitochondrial phosphate transporter), member 23/24/25/41
MSAAGVREVFERLDTDKSGSLDMDEVALAMRSMGIPITKQLIDKVFKRLDLDNDGKVTLQEFAAYCEIRLAEIRKTFDAIDTDQNGRISTEEIKLCVQALGMKISSQQLRDIMGHVITGSHGTMSFDEFVNALLLLPATNPEAVFEAWQSMPLDDAESGFSVPRDARTALRQSMVGAILQQLYSGGIAGAISRTATAPIDRVKVMAQAAPPGSKSLG